MPHLPPRSLSRAFGGIPAAILCASLLACTTGGQERSLEGSPSADPCAFDGTAETVASECVPDPGLSPAGPLPASSADIDPVRLPPAENELARAANDDDPALTEASFEVKIPAGARLRSTVACNGIGPAVLTTEPDSGARQEIRCEYGGEGVELTVTAATPVSAAQAYVVRFEATGPARWSVVLSYQTGSPSADPIGS